MLQRCEHFPQTNHTRPSTTDTNSTVTESHAGQRWRSEPAGRSGLDTATLTAVCRDGNPCASIDRLHGPGFVTRSRSRRAESMSGARASVKRVAALSSSSRWRLRRGCTQSGWPQEFLAEHRLATVESSAAAFLDNSDSWSAYVGVAVPIGPLRRRPRSDRVRLPDRVRLDGVHHGHATAWPRDSRDVLQRVQQRRELTHAHRPTVR